MGMLSIVSEGSTDILAQIDQTLAASKRSICADCRSRSTMTMYVGGMSPLPVEVCNRFQSTYRPDHVASDGTQMYRRPGGGLTDSERPYCEDINPKEDCAGFSRTLMSSATLKLLKLIR